jgi:hypothetical protein
LRMRFEKTSCAKNMTFLVPCSALLSVSGAMRGRLDSRPEQNMKILLILSLLVLSVSFFSCHLSLFVLIACTF